MSVSGKCSPMSPRPAAPKIESAIECNKTSPSECATISKSHSIFTPPRVIPFPCLYLCKSKPIPPLVRNLFK